MADFAPPSGPPPPKAPEVPAGWAVRWNDQYKEWFYVNIYTKQSQWEKPTAPGGGFGGGGRKPGGGGMGMMGGAALGAGAGLLGGAMIANSFDNDEQDAYQDGFEDGAGFGDDGGD
ncbi:rna-binding protein [Fusarium fujikuroi]|nr:rna-binding protein [Fusarium fujikuroi]